MTIVQMNFEGNRGYSADDVGARMTLDEFISEVEDARDEWGGDAIIVVHQNNNRGANFGHVSRWPLFEEAGSDEDDDAY